MKKEEYYSRDYNFADIEQDPRLARSTVEMKITVAYYTVYMSVVILVCYYLAEGPATEYTYLLGLPTYLTVMSIIAFIGMIGVLVLSKFLFVEEDLSPSMPGVTPLTAPSTDAQTSEEGGQ